LRQAHGPYHKGTRIAQPHKNGWSLRSTEQALDDKHRQHRKMSNIEREHQL